MITNDNVQPDFKNVISQKRLRPQGHDRWLQRVLGLLRLTCGAKHSDAISSSLVRKPTSILALYSTSPAPTGHQARPTAELKYFNAMF